MEVWLPDICPTAFNGKSSCSGCVWQVTKFRSSGFCGVTSGLEAGQRLGLILKARDNIKQVDHLKHPQHPAARTEQFQVTTLTSEGKIQPCDGANGGTIHLRQVGQVQQQLANAMGNQFL